MIYTCLLRESLTKVVISSNKYSTLIYETIPYTIGFRLEKHNMTVFLDPLKKMTQHYRLHASKCQLKKITKHFP